MCLSFLCVSPVIIFYVVRKSQKHKGIPGGYGDWHTAVVVMET